MNIDRIKHIAGVAHIDLTDDELKVFEKEIDELFGLLNTIDDAPESDAFCFEPVGIFDALRDDIPAKDDNAEEMLKSIGTYNGYVRGPKIV